LVKLRLVICGSRYAQIKWRFYFGKHEDPFSMYARGLKRELAEKMLSTLKWKLVEKTGFHVSFETQVTDQMRRALIALEHMPTKQLKQIKAHKLADNTVTAIAIGELLR
jgi:hypothetical protein